MRSTFAFGFNLLMMLAITLSITLHTLLTPATAQMSDLSDFSGSSPSAVVDQFLAADRPEEFTDDDVGIFQLSVAGDYAYASYYWGEGGGFLVLQRDESSEWSILAADGGAPDGGQTFVEYGVSLVDAQVLWDQVEADRAQQ
jgi:hypothetical protein